MSIPTIVVVGTTDGGFIAVARYNPNGTLDTSFGNGGKARTLTKVGEPTAATMDSSGRILIAGSTGSYYARDFGVMRLRADGTLDTGFGAGGLATVTFGPDSYYYGSQDLAWRSRGQSA